MKAIVCKKFGPPDGLQLEDIEKPVPADNEVLVKVFATTVTAGDVMVRRLTFPRYLVIWSIARILFGIKNLRKKILGHEFAFQQVRGIGDPRAVCVWDCPGNAASVGAGTATYRDNPVESLA